MDDTYECSQLYEVGMISMDADMYVLCIGNLEGCSGKCILDKLASEQHIRECMFKTRDACKKLNDFETVAWIIGV